MDLWIRSQDKAKLCEVKSLMYYENEDNEYCIAHKESASYIQTLGKYKSKERALEILDNIQNFIIGKGLTSLSLEAFALGVSEASTDKQQEILKQQFVYEMPKE